MSAQRWADNITMWSNAVGTFNRPLASVQVYKKFVWVLGGFIEMLIIFIFNLKTLKKKLIHDLGDTLLHYKTKNENRCHPKELL